jgi:hypothetical protein
MIYFFATLRVTQLVVYCHPGQALIFCCLLATTTPAPVVLLDESGLFLNPVVRQIWALRGGQSPRIGGNRHGVFTAVHLLREMLLHPHHHPQDSG